MALYRYVKTYPKKRPNPKWISFAFIGCGALLLAWVIWPILSFKLSAGDLFSGTVSPVSEISANVRNGVSPLVVASGNDVGGHNKQTNFSNPDNWYPAKPQKRVVTPVNSYTLSIPKLKIENAMVTIAGDDLDNSLIHYGGTALPGEFGTTVIFGHSTLPQLYDPKNYKTIFTLLPTLKPAKENTPGDQIFLTYDGITYKYEIYDMVVTKPEDLSSLEQKYDDSYLTLITCVPPGTYWERMNVRAKLIPLQ
jgi:sortase A